MTVYKCDIYEIQKHTQVKAILLTFTIESSSSYFLIHSVYNTYALVAEFDYVRPRNKFFECFTLFYLIQLDTPLIPSRFVVFSIMEVTFTLGRFLIFFQVRYLLLIWSSCSYGINSILSRFIDQCWAIKKIVKKQSAISPFQVYRQLHHHTFPKLTSTYYFSRPRHKSNSHKWSVELAHRNHD